MEVEEKVRSTAFFRRHPARRSQGLRPARIGLNRGLLLALWLPVALLLVVLSCDSDARGASHLPTGIANMGRHSETDTQIVVARVAGTGAKFASNRLDWRLIAPEERPPSWDPTDPGHPSYDWTATDRWVAAMKQSGLVPVLKLFNAPDWAQRCSRPTNIPTFPGAVCDPDPSDTAAFAKAAAARYSGRFRGLPRVKYWQILNEPNLPLFFNPVRGANGNPLSPGLYRDILRSTYPSIKSAHPGNVVIGAGLAPDGEPPYSMAPLDFARRLFCLNRKNRPTKSSRNCRGGVKLDVFAMHPYTSGGPTHEAVGRDNVQLGNLGDLKSLLRAADRARRIDGRFRTTPLWITEMAWDSRPPDPGGLPMRILKRWTAEAVYRSWRVGVSAFFWHTIRDAPQGVAWNMTSQSSFFLRGDSVETDQAKPNLQAFRFPFVAFSKSKRKEIGRRKDQGVRFWGRTPAGRSGRVVVQFKRNGRWRRLAAVRAKNGGIFRGFERSRLLSKNRGAVRAVFRGEPSVPFSLKPVKDFPHSPFG